LPALARPRAKLRSRVATARRRRRIGVTRWPPQSRSPRHNPVPRSPFPPPLHFLLTPFQFGKAEWELTPSLHPLASSSVTAPPFFYSICLQLRLDLRHPVRLLLPSFSLWIAGGISSSRAGSNRGSPGGRASTGGAGQGGRR
jgi:hypothetical protein